MKSLAQYKNIFAVIVVILVFVFLMKKMVEKNSLVMKDLEAQKSELEKGRELISKWQAADRQIQEASRAFFKDSSSFRSLVEESAQKSNITVESLTPAKQEKDLYTEATINLKGIAKRYSQITDFITSIEGASIMADNLKVKRDTEGKQGIDMDVTLKVFIIRD